MKMSGGPASVNFKILLLIIALAIAGGTLFYTQNLVKKLQERERNIVELYAKGISYLASSDSEEPGADYTFLFENIIKPIDFPMLITDKDDIVNPDNKRDFKNETIDSTLPNAQINS